MYVGNVPVKLLTGGNQAKSGYDAGIHSLQTMLKYKCEHAGIGYQEASEAYSTQVRSARGALPLRVRKVGQTSEQGTGHVATAALCMTET